MYTMNKRDAQSQWEIRDSWTDTWRKISRDLLVAIELYLVTWHAHDFRVQLITTSGRVSQIISIKLLGTRREGWAL